MATILDILAGMMVGGMLILMAGRAMDNAMQRFVNNNADAMVQDELASTTEVIQNDLWKMGYGIPEANQTTIIQIAQPNQLKYLTYFNNNDGIPDTIEYTLSVMDTTDFIDTVIVLFSLNRSAKDSQGSTTSGMIGTISNTNIFRYFDQIGNPAGILLAIKMVEVTLVAKNPHIYLSDEVILAASPQERMTELRKLIAESYWRQTRVISKNLRR